MIKPPCQVQDKDKAEQAQTGYQSHQGYSVDRHPRDISHDLALLWQFAFSKHIRQHIERDAHLSH